MVFCRQNIILIGYMGTGKSSVSKKLSHLLKRDCVEMDGRIEQEAGMAIPDIFEKYGEDYFRDIESQVLLKALGRDNQIISCGGGVVLRDENLQAMKRHGKIVLLTASPETIFQRVLESKDSRPLLKDNLNKAYIEKMMAERAERYQLACDIKISTDGKMVKDIAEEIIGCLGDSTMD